MQLQELQKEIGKWFVDHYKKVKEDLDKVGEYFEPLDHHDIYSDLDLYFGDVLRFKDDCKDCNFFTHIFRKIIDRELDRLDLQAIADKVNKELAL